MTYQVVMNMLRDTGAAVNPAGTFVNAIGGRKNASEYYDSPSPQIFPIRLTSNRGTLSNQRIWNASILFITQDRTETNELEREQIKSDMDVLSTVFMNYLALNYKVTVNVIDNPEDKILAGTYSGWFGTFTITTLNQC